MDNQEEDQKTMSEVEGREENLDNARISTTQVFGRDLPSESGVLLVSDEVRVCLRVPRPIIDDFSLINR